MGSLLELCGKSTFTADVVLDLHVGGPYVSLPGVGSILDTVAKDTEDTGVSVSLSLS